MKSGVAILFGAHMKKKMFLGACSNFCSIFVITKNKEQESPKRLCYGNLAESLVAMETDIVVEGFANRVQLWSENMHVIGDGDSSVMVCKKARNRLACSIGTLISGWTHIHYKLYI